jgi:hypothetical protein
MSLKGKRILFIAPRFFGYEQLIKTELEEQGASVDYYDDRPGGDFLTKALIRVDRRLLARKTNLYYGSIVVSSRGRDYDHIFIVRAEAISATKLRELKVEHPRARVTLYLWDSMNYNPNAKQLLDCFDSVWSFDRDDANAFEKVRFLPLFYAKGFASTSYPAQHYEYDACFIGTLHTNRYKVLEKIVDQLQSNGDKVFLYCYYPSKTLFRLRSLVDSGFRRFGRKYLKFESIPLSKTIEYFEKSRIIIDINRPAQLGLTIRTIETLGARRKLLTTNKDVVNYDLYDPSWVHIADRDAPKISEIINDEVPVFDENNWEKYSVGRWIATIFSPDQSLQE